MGLTSWASCCLFHVFHMLLYGLLIFRIRNESVIFPLLGLISIRRCAAKWNIEPLLVGIEVPETRCATKMDRVLYWPIGDTPLDADVQRKYRRYVLVRVDPFECRRATQTSKEPLLANLHCHFKRRYATK
jgi:hypothetical protein